MNFLRYYIISFVLNFTYCLTETNQLIPNESENEINYLPFPVEPMFIAFKPIAKSNHNEFPSTCSMCNSTLTVIEKLFRMENMTVDIIQAAAKVVCDLNFGPVESAACNIIVDKVDILLKWLADGVSIDDCCKRLKLCPGNPFEIAHETSLCQTCDKVIETVKSVVVNNESRIPLIKEALEMICSHSNEKEKCTFILDAFDEIIKMLESDITADQICKNIGLCSANSLVKSPINPNKFNILNDMQFLTSVGEMLEQGNLLDQGANDVLSDKLHFNFDKPSNFDDEELTDKSYSPDTLKLDLIFNVPQMEGLTSINTMRVEKTNDRSDLFQDILNDKDNREDKEIIDKSNDDLTELIKFALEDQSIINNEDFPFKNVDQNSKCCPLCTFPINYMKKIIQRDSSSIPIIEAEIEFICSRFPKKSGCEKILKQLEEIISLLQQGKSADECCEKLHMCKSNNDTDFIDFLNEVDMNNLTSLESVSSILNDKSKSMKKSDEKIDPSLSIMNDQSDEIGFTTDELSQEKKHTEAMKRFQAIE